MANKKYREVMVIRRQIDELRLKGWTGYRIAQELGMRERTVYKHIEEIKKEEILEISQADKEQIRKEAEKRYLRQVEIAERELGNALEREKRLVSVQREGEKGSYIEEKVEMLLPDYAAAAKFQANLLKAQDSIAKLYGVALRQPGESEENPIWMKYANVSDEEIDDRLRRMARAADGEGDAPGAEST